MTKFLQELNEMFPNIKNVRKRTKEILDSGDDLAFKEIYDAKSFERLKNYIKKTQ